MEGMHGGLIWLDRFLVKRARAEELRSDQMKEPGPLLTIKQVFVANPHKPPQIAAILKRNRDKLVGFLKEFHNDKEGASHSRQDNSTLLLFIYLNVGPEYQKRGDTQNL